MLLSRGLRKVLDCQVVRLDTKRGTNIVAAYIPFRRDTKPTILFSHGNAVDLALMLPFYREIARELQVNLMGYDYSGYGASTGLPTVLNTFTDIEACLVWLLQQGKQPEDIILYGQSVGSGPTCHLAAKTPKLGGVVLHSPLATGMRVMNPTWNYWPTFLDVYPNIRLVPKIAAPLLILHGTKDEVVDISAGRALHAAAKNPVAPLWAQNCNHQNVELSPEYLLRLRAFVRDVGKH
ncbi:alpha/beta-hydrolase [Coccomyxa subellipsoidea C-169]|uniref:Alpha/beta-hydrolase n=1 Tax=Coccomyxa subellipsoidea (strain C-169) TaxID=574566 RepID=I0Z1Y7_COCSC|nr:alpha/beta-hydrolase [Coccomyxa subellipsoidea C-169]EIE24656.1 alpha/beta-hydrolase [Coccomyxa subellipsoidea C-169]|eukprot:XP_005649200.1 alpha/beta-hydrolase [Coccomyxa subellipsoidea C-169]